MGFGFNLFVFPFLVFSTIGLIIIFIISKNKTWLKILAGIWIFIVLLFVNASLTSKFHKPFIVTKELTVGTYRIDKSFYPGKNADWQYDHFRFKISPNDSLYFYVINNDTAINVFKGKLSYSTGTQATWIIQTDTTHHVIKYPPTLYRERHNFYHVFRSDKYGNMFFRKQRN